MLLQRSRPIPRRWEQGPANDDLGVSNGLDAS